MSLIKSLVQKGFYNYGVVKTSFSKLLLDETSEVMKEGITDCASCYTLLCLLCLHV